MYEFASSSATLLTVYTAVMHTRRMNVIPEAELWNYDTYITELKSRQPPPLAPTAAATGLTLYTRQSGTRKQEQTFGRPLGPAGADSQTAHFRRPQPNRSCRTIRILLESMKARLPNCQKYWHIRWFYA